MTEGWRPVDAAVAGVEIVENDPNSTWNIRSSAHRSQAW
jgi:hypothetical protein